ncbi:glycosyltransferase family 2 protein [Flavobacterium sp.]|uniref:glycosyltransferase family 2 protein n=1 Tax=Flavobacterium sp. TaxID=239 RepID=UPI003D13CDA8
MNLSKKNIAVVIPAYNESGNIKVMLDALHQTLSKLPYVYKIVFVDDGSGDATLETLKGLSATDEHLFFVELSKNFGHQNALKAGVDTVVNSSDAIITMDGDMQHPPEMLPELLAKWEEGYDVVYTRREEDQNLSTFKKKTSKGFYNLMNYLSEVKFEPGTADFRLMDQKVALVFSDFKENDLFIRGLVNWLGFKQYGIDFKPAPRFAGNSKYTVKKMFRFALQGITSFSTRPLHIAVFLGVITSFTSFVLYMGYIVYSMYYGHVISGWASLISTVVFFGGLNLIVLGIIGIYVGKLFMQSKNRPNYLIRETNYKG